MFVSRTGVIQDATLSKPRLRESLAIQMSMPIDESRNITLSKVDHQRKLRMDDPIPSIESSGPCCSPGMPSDDSTLVCRSIGGIDSAEVVTGDLALPPAAPEKCLAE